MKKRTKNIILISLIVLILSFFAFSFLRENIVYDLTKSDIESFIEDVESFGPLSAFVLIALVILEVILAPLPPLILYVAAGIMFGTLLGGILVLVGNILGALLAFYIARTIAHAYITKKINKKTKKRFDKLTEKYGSLAIFFLRINPFTSSDIFSYLAGLSSMKPSHFALATALGLAPLIFVQTYLGADIIRTNPVFFIIFVILSVIYIAIFIYMIFFILLRTRKGLKSRREKNDEPSRK